MFDKTPRHLIDYHHSMLADTTRTEALARAVAQAVRPGDVVLDLGCGTGILSFFALRAGARQVYAVEMGSVVAMARAVAARNGAGDALVFFNRPANEVDLPERADVLVTETIGNCAFDEGILGAVLDARRRLLKPGARIVPQTLALALAPVEGPALTESTVLWRDGAYGLDFAPVHALAVNNPDWVELGPEQLLAPAQTVAHCDLTTVTADEAAGEAVWTVERDGTFDGVGAWFVSELIAGETLSNAPPSAAPSWRQALFPLTRPLAVAAGDEVRIAIEAAANGAVWRWRVWHGDTAFDQSTFLGDLLSPAELRRRDPDFVPHRDEEGEVDLFVLERMSGKLPLHALAAQLSAAFPDRFPTVEQALHRVRLLAQRYGV